MTTTEEEFEGLNKKYFVLGYYINPILSTTELLKNRYLLDHREYKIRLRKEARAVYMFGRNLSETVKS